MWKQFFYVYKITYISPLQYRTNLLIPFVDMRIERKKRLTLHLCLRCVVLCRDAQQKVWDPSCIVGGVSDAIITCAAVCMFCFGSLLLRTCSYCLSLYANQVNWYSVLSFTTAFNFTIHFKWSLNPVEDKPVEMNKYISHAWFCGLFLYCEPSCTIQYKTSEFWSFYLLISLPILS